MGISFLWPRLRSVISGAAVVSAISLGATVAKAEVRIVALGDSAIRGHGVAASKSYRVSSRQPLKRGGITLRSSTKALTATQREASSRDWMALCRQAPIL